MTATRWDPPPRVSVIIPTFNRARYLEATLASIFAQSVPVHEILLVDDGSIDDTAVVVRSLLDRHPDWHARLQYLQRAHEGKSAALNAALAIATGDWIAFDDSDDRWLPDKLQLQLAALDRYGEADACFTDARFMNESREETALAVSGPHYDDRFGLERDVPRLYRTPAWPGIYMQTVLVSAAVMRRLGGFDTSVRMSMDTDFMFRLGLATPVCFVNVPLVEIDRAEGHTGLTTEYPMGSVERLLVHERLLTKWLALSRAARPDLHAGLSRRRSIAQSALANQYLLAGDVAQARAVLRRALGQHRPMSLVGKYLLAMLAPGLLRAEIQRRRARMGA